MSPLFLFRSTTAVVVRLPALPCPFPIRKAIKTLNSAEHSSRRLPVTLQQRCAHHLAAQQQQRYLYNMNTVYFRAKPQDTVVQINFHYVNPELQIDRVFNLARSITESVDSCLGRIRANVEKEMQKKQRRTKKNKKGNSDNESVGQAVVPDLDDSSVVQLCREDGPVQGPSIVQDVLSACPAGLTNLRLEIFGVVFRVYYNLPWVNLIVLPTSMLTGYFVYPTKLNMECAEMRECDFQWFKEKDGDTNTESCWEHVGQSWQWRVTPDCVGRRLKVVCTPKNGPLSGPSVEAVSTTVVLEGPTGCLYEPRHKFTATRLDGNRFRVVTFNLLADNYADSDYSRTVLFPYCPPAALDIDYRKQLFVAELLGYQSDVICLQEVDNKIFDYDLQPVLGFQNYAGTFSRKGQTSEGLATFYNADRFNLIEAFSINIGDSLSTLPIFAEFWSVIRSNVKLADRISARSTTIQVSALQSKTSGKVLCVANTHLYFHPDADHIRLLQFRLGLLYVQHIRETILERLRCAEKDVSIVFCGDFNSVPECGIYKLMTEKYVPAGFKDFSSNAEESLTDLALEQPFNIDSAYKDIPFTNYTVGFTACIDHIFYQTDDLSVVQVVPTPSEELLKAHTAIPSVVHPSDHIALVADLEWRSDPVNKQL